MKNMKITGIYNKMLDEIDEQYSLLLKNDFIIDIETDSKFKELYSEITKIPSPFINSLEFAIFIIGSKYLLLYDQALVIDCILDLIKKYFINHKMFHYTFSQIVKSDEKLQLIKELFGDKIKNGKQN